MMDNPIQENQFTSCAKGEHSHDSLGLNEAKATPITVVKEMGPLIASDSSCYQVDPANLRKLAKDVSTTVDFDNGRGDLTLIVTMSEPDEEDSKEKAKPTAFQVSSSAMIRASVVWRSQFTKAFAESQPNYPKILDCTEDDAASLEILMDVIHLRFNRVPPTLSLDDLTHLAFLTNRYYATAVMGPWIAGWVQCLESTVSVLGNENKWLWIAWEFGLEDIFQRVYRSLCMNMSTVHEEDTTAQLSPPPSVEDKAQSNREDVISFMLDAIYGYYDGLQLTADELDAANDDSFGPTLRRDISEEEQTDSHERYCSESSRECIAMQIGSIFRTLSKSGLWPKKVAGEIDMSPRQLQEELICIQMLDCKKGRLFKKSSRYSSWSDYISCGYFDEILKRIKEAEDQLSVPAELQEGLHRQHSLWSFAND